MATSARIARAAVSSFECIGYLARACLRFNFSGAAAHCSFGIGNFIEVSG